MMDQTPSPFLPLLCQSPEKPIPLWAHFSLTLEGFLPPWEGRAGRAEGTSHGAEQGACSLSGQERFLSSIFFGRFLSFNLHCIEDCGGRGQTRKLRLREDCVHRRASKAPTRNCHAIQTQFPSQRRLCKPKGAHMAQLPLPGGPLGSRH